LGYNTYIHGNVIMKLYRYLKQKVSSFAKIEDKKVKHSVWRLVTMWGKDIRKGCRRVNSVEI
jgi:hypothetical protein